jgi:hypothetical protein
MSRKKNHGIWSIMLMISVDVFVQLTPPPPEPFWLCGMAHTSCSGAEGSELQRKDLTPQEPCVNTASPPWIRRWPVSGTQLSLPHRANDGSSKERRARHRYQRFLAQHGNRRSSCRVWRQAGRRGGPWKQGRMLGRRRWGARFIVQQRSRPSSGPRPLLCQFSWKFWQSIRWPPQLPLVHFGTQGYAAKRKIGMFRSRQEGYWYAGANYRSPAKRACSFPVGVVSETQTRRPSRSYTPRA